MEQKERTDQVDINDYVKTMDTEDTITPALPEDFLSTPAPTIIASRIDFSQTALPEYRNRYACILDGVLSPAECRTLIQAAEYTTKNVWQRAMVNIGGGKQMLMSEERNCGRIIWDSQDMVSKVWDRIKQVPEVQEIVRLENCPQWIGNWPGLKGEVWKFSRPNERMRFLKYVGGEYFRPHCDGTYSPPGGQERSFFTMHLYLNSAGKVTSDELEHLDLNQKEEAKKNRLLGGATTFHSLDMRRKLDVDPKAGRVLLFQHRDLLHSGDDVLRGVKYTMRTDMLYALESSKSKAKSKKNEPSSMPTLDESMSDDETGDVNEAQWFEYWSKEEEDDHYYSASSDEELEAR